MTKYLNTDYGKWARLRNFQQPLIGIKKQKLVLITIKAKESLSEHQSYQMLKPATGSVLPCLITLLYGKHFLISLSSFLLLFFSRNVCNIFFLLYYDNKKIFFSRWFHIGAIHKIGAFYVNFGIRNVCTLKKLHSMW